MGGSLEQGFLVEKIFPSRRRKNVYYFFFFSPLPSFSYLFRGVGGESWGLRGWGGVERRERENKKINCKNRYMRTEEQKQGLVGCTFKVFIILAVFVMYML